MGSGLILLVIVAAWLAVLVPMALRSHESSTSLSSVDRFSDAMRVLSRRDAAARARTRREADDDPLSAAAYAEGAGDRDDEWNDAWDLDRPSWRERLARCHERVAPVLHRVPVPRLPPLRRSAVRRPGTPAGRRRRLLLALTVLTAGCLVGGAVGSGVLLGVGAGLLLALALFVLQLRRLAVARARRLAVARAAARPAPPVRRRPAVSAAVTRTGSVRVRPARAQAPAESAPTLQADAPAAAREPVEVRLDQPRTVPAAAEEPYDVRSDQPRTVPAAADVPYDVEAIEAEESGYGASAATAHTWLPPVAREPSPAPAAALGEAWSPVPVPPPTYVTAPVAPRTPRIVDLTRPGAWSRAEAARAAEELPGSAPKAEPAPERRRAVNEW